MGSPKTGPLALFLGSSQGTGAFPPAAMSWLVLNGAGPPHTTGPCSLAPAHPGWRGPFVPRGVSPEKPRELRAGARRGLPKGKGRLCGEAMHSPGLSSSLAEASDTSSACSPGPEDPLAAPGGAWSRAGAGGTVLLRSLL